MISFNCFRARRRLGAFLDDALPEGRSEAIVSHLSSCEGCRGEATRLKRLRSLLRATLRPGPEPDWSGFWPAIRERLLAETPRPVGREPWWRLGWRPVWSHPRLTVGGALAGLLLLTAALWQSDVWRSGHAMSPWMIVSSVETVQPNSSVMVFSSHDSEMTMIWVFGLERGDDQSLRHPDPTTGGRV